MKNLDDEQIGKFLRDAVAPLGQEEPQFDLWPKMRVKLERRSIRVSWFDWVLALIVLVICLLIPEALGGLLFHL